MTWPRRRPAAPLRRTATASQVDEGRVDAVERVDDRSGAPLRLRVPRVRRLAVVRVKVPASAGRPSPSISQPRDAPTPAVEVLHRGPLASFSEGGELAPVAQEVVVRDQFDAERLEGRGPFRARRLHGDHRARREGIDVGVQALPHRGGTAQVDGEALLRELDREPAHRSDEQVHLLVVPGALGELPVAHDHEDTGLCGVASTQVGEIEVELISPHPDAREAGVRGHRHARRVCRSRDALAVVSARILDTTVASAHERSQEPRSGPVRAVSRR